MDPTDVIQWVLIFLLIGAVGMLAWITNRQIDKIDRLKIQMGTHRHSPGDGRLMNRDPAD